MFMGKAMPMRSKSCWTGGLPKRKTSTALPAIQSTGDILRNWIAMSRVHIKESTYSRYIHLANAHILPYLGELPTGKLTTQTVEKHISFLLNKGRVDKKGGLAPKTVSDILTLI